MTARGLTLIEATISLAVFAALFGTVAGSLVQDSRAHEAIVAHMGPEMKVRRILHRMATEIRMAGVWAEDRDHDGELDEGEDLNLNEVLDSDWNLGDGEKLPELSFNAREDLRDADGTLLATGVYTSKRRFYVENGTLYRETTRYEEGKPQARRAILATRIHALEFEREGGLVVVRATVRVNLAGGRSKDHVLETRVWLRN